MMSAQIKFKDQKLVNDPLPRLWEYKHDDRGTWPYLDCIIAGKEGEAYVSKWIKNPNFKYNHLMKGN